MAHPPILFFLVISMKSSAPGCAQLWLNRIAESEIAVKQFSF
jgi:hypothetical protein